MASDMNDVILEGRLTADPETRLLPSGSKVAKFRIANNKYRPVADFDEANPEYRKFTTFMAVDAWNSLAEKCQTLQKGSRVRITGQLKQEQWESADGDPRSRIVLNAQTVLHMK